MKKMILLLSVAICSAVTVRGDYFGLWDENVKLDKEIEFVDYTATKSEGSIIHMQQLLRKDLMNPNLNGSINSRTIKKNGIGISSDYSTVRTSSGNRSGGTISDRNRSSRQSQIDRQARFAKMRQENARRAAAAAARKRAEEQRRDNDRAVQAEANANARLQGRTNANMARDQYNATVGKYNAQQTARQTAAALQVGPKKIERQQPKVSGQTYASALQQQSNRDRTRRPQNKVQRKPVNTVRRYETNANGQYVFTGRATKTSIYIKPDGRFGTPTKAMGPRSVRGNQGFRLSPNAVVTTGRPIKSPDVGRNERQIPPPVTRVTRKLTHEEEMDMKIKEFLS